MPLKLTKKQHEQVLKEIPPIAELWSKIGKRSTLIIYPRDGQEFLIQTLICLTDFATIFQMANVQIREAKLSWVSHTNVPEGFNSTLAPAAVAAMRSHLDFSIIASSAASNHLASAFWHFQQKVANPLGKKYKSVNSVYEHWQSSKLDTEVSRLLAELVESQAWKLIIVYRHKWVNRSMPTLVGEMKLSKVEVWNKSSTPLPKQFNVRTTLPDGRTTDSVNFFRGEYEPEALLKASIELLSILNETGEKFLELFDSKLLEDEGWAFRDGNLIRTKLF